VRRKAQYTGQAVGAMSSRHEDDDDDNRPPPVHVEYAFYPHRWAWASKTVGRGPDEVTTKFLYDGDNVVAEHLTDGTVTDQNTVAYVTPFLDQTLSLTTPTGLPYEDTHYYMQDGLGSVRNIVKATTNAVMNSSNYEAFGQGVHTGTVEAVRQPFAFTGRRRDKHRGQMHYRHRAYLLRAGRGTN
jgi:hypothetical protein